MEVQESIQLLTEAKTLLHETGVLKEKSTYLTKESKTLEKDLRAIKKLVEDTIQEKLKAAQDKINETYDGDIASASASIKTEKANRDKALEAGKKERIAKETEGLHAQIKEVNEQAKAFFKEKGLPSFCNSDFFYSIFSPKTAKDFGIFVLCFAIVFALLPFCIYNLIPAKGALPIILIYIILIVIFAGLYIFVSEKTKMTHPTEIQTGRSYRNAIADCKKKIKQIETSIAKDDNESYYDLSAYDTALEQFKATLADLTNKKEAAVAEFENVTRGQITQEIKDQYHDKIDAMERDFAQMKVDISNAKDDLNKKELAFRDNYGKTIEKAYWKEDALDKLIEILKNGDASDIAEAQTVYKAK